MSQQTKGKDTIMIKEKELRDFRPDFQYKNGREITLNLVREKLEIAMNNASAPVAFEKDQIKTGGIFNSNSVDCLVMYHPEHTKDYFKFCIYIIYDGNDAVVCTREYGQSKQMDKAYRSEIAKKGVKDYFRLDAEDYSAIGNAIGSAIGGALGSIGKSKKKLEAEKMYYSLVYEVLDEVIC